MLPASMLQTSRVPQGLHHQIPIPEGHGREVGFRRVPLVWGPHEGGLFEVFSEEARCTQSHGPEATTGMAPAVLCGQALCFSHLVSQVLVPHCRLLQHLSLCSQQWVQIGQVISARLFRCPP
jgi:hypothetical protein